MRHSRNTILYIAMLLAGVSAYGADVTFSKAPTVTKQSGQTQIAFTVSASTDVEVAVLNIRGEVVRHLAAGGPGGNSSCCVCRVPRFDVDRYGRVAMPSSFAPTTMLYDNAGNLIAEVGRYGNFDSQYLPAGTKDAQPAVRMPEIPVAWPSGTGFSEKHLYINDTTNRRIVRVDWTWQAEKDVSF